MPVFGIVQGQVIIGIIVSYPLLVLYGLGLTSLLSRTRSTAVHMVRFRGLLSTGGLAAPFRGGGRLIPSALFGCLMTRPAVLTHFLILVTLSGPVFS